MTRLELWGDEEGSKEEPKRGTLRTTTHAKSLACSSLALHAKVLVG